MNKGIIDNAAKRYNEMKDTYSKYNKTHNFPGKSFIESNPETPVLKLYLVLCRWERSSRMGRAGSKALKKNQLEEKFSQKFNKTSS